MKSRLSLTLGDRVCQDQFFSTVKMEWDNNYIGNAPLIQTITGSMGYYKYITVKAYPIYDGQYVQRKFLLGKQPLPRTIYFDMYLKPASKEYDINIR